MLYSILSNTLYRRNSLENLAESTCLFLINSDFPQVSRGQAENLLAPVVLELEAVISDSKEIKPWIQIAIGQTIKLSRKV